MTKLFPKNQFPGNKSSKEGIVDITDELSCYMLLRTTSTLSIMDSCTYDDPLRVHIEKIEYIIFRVGTVEVTG